MFLPSNDWFIADQNGAGVDISALLDGTSTEQTIDVTTVYDAGTELEDFFRGGTGPDPFSLTPRLSDANGGNPNDQNDSISTVTRMPSVNLFENFVNVNNEPIARFLGASSGSLGTVRLSVISDVLLGDVNVDGRVDFSDISPFIAVLTAGTFQAEADVNESGEVNFQDVSPFIEILSSP